MASSSISLFIKRTDLAGSIQLHHSYLPYHITRLFVTNLRHAVSKPLRRRSVQGDTKRNVRTHDVAAGKFDCPFSRAYKAISLQQNRTRLLHSNFRVFSCLLYAMEHGMAPAINLWLAASPISLDCRQRLVVVTSARI
eukprot:6069429-Pleurochrysis_carterae.AAC.3